VLDYALSRGLPPPRFLRASSLAIWDPADAYRRGPFLLASGIVIWYYTKTMEKPYKSNCLIEAIRFWLKDPFNTEFCWSPVHTWPDKMHFYWKKGPDYFHFRATADVPRFWQRLWFEGVMSPMNYAEQQFLCLTLPL